MVNDAALRAVFEAFLNAPQHAQHPIFIDASTVAPSLTAELAARATARGIGECVPSRLSAGSVGFVLVCAKG